VAGPNQIPGPTAIRAPTLDLKNHQTVLTQLKETTETASRLRGNPNQSYVTLGELIDAGIVKFLGGVVSPGPKIGSGGGATAVNVADSIQGDGSVGNPLELVGDAASPGNNKLYGTNGSGARGWYAQPAGGSISVTDGTNTVSGATSLRFNGAVVSGTTPNANVTITSGGGIGVPGTISNLCYWFQADVLVSGNTFIPILLNQTPGLSSYSASVVSSANITISTTLNSKNVATFTASTEYALPGSGPVLLNSTIFVVLKPTSLGTTQVIFGDGPGASLAFFINSSSKLSLVVEGVSLVGASTGSLSTSAWVQANATFAGASGAFAFRISQSASGSGTQVASATAGSGGVCCSGNGSGGSSGNSLNAQVAELIVYNRVLTGTEIANIESYLFTKWGV
jgi:hypothetical protein